MQKYMLALNSGTTSNRGILINHLKKLPVLPNKNSNKFIRTPGGWNTGRPTFGKITKIYSTYFFIEI
jgi:glycerol kinase